MDLVPGRFAVTSTHAAFTPLDSSTGQSFSWALSKIKEVHLRRYDLRPSALEVFLTTHATYFLNFNENDRQKVC